ncbi:uncharacterized protein G2W53_027152 [Senna tora]|uniref:Uncharacterized protein n=1 Tax=Senna tora TaxID=362788 RepID=A0A834TGE8_9FABA|nr:uncharacterized protein G2W53_027152 [Senna tora]
MGTCTFRSKFSPYVGPSTTIEIRCFSKKPQGIPTRILEPNLIFDRSIPTFTAFTFKPSRAHNSSWVAFLRSNQRLTPILGVISPKGRNHPETILRGIRSLLE